MPVGDIGCRVGWVVEEEDEDDWDEGGESHGAMQDSIAGQ